MVNSDIVSLIVREFSKLSTKSRQMELSDFLVKFFWQYVNLSLLILVSVSVFPEIDLSNNLVGEGV